MSDTMVFLLVVGALVLFAAGARYWWRVTAGATIAEGSLRFSRVLHRLGIDLGKVESERTLREAAINVRRCLTCREREACDAWLASGEPEGVVRFCPNAPLLRALSRS
jgi:hypothetical protein